MGINLRRVIISTTKSLPTRNITATWTTKENQLTLIYLMRTRHIGNCIAMLYRVIDDHREFDTIDDEQRWNKRKKRCKKFIHLFKQELQWRRARDACEPNLDNL